MKKAFVLVLVAMLSFFFYCCTKVNLNTIMNEVSLKDYSNKKVNADIKTNLEELKDKYKVDIKVEFNDHEIASYENSIIKIKKKSEDSTLIVKITVSYKNQRLSKLFKIFIAKIDNPLPEPSPNPEPNPPTPAPEPDPNPTPKNAHPVIKAVQANENEKVTAIGWIVAYYLNFGVALQDSTGGITLKSGKNDSVKFSQIQALIGKYVQVSGTRVVYNGLVQISKITEIKEITNPEESFPTALDITKLDIAKHQARLQSTLVSISNAKVKSFEKDKKYGNINIVFEFFGKTLAFRYDSRVNKAKWTALLENLKPGKHYDLTNLVFSFYNQPQCSISETFEFKPHTNETGKINVFFDLNGGTIAGGVQPQIIDVGQTAKNPGSPTKHNYEFLGWSKTGRSDDIFNFNAKLTEDTTLKAVYKYNGPEEDLDDVNGYYSSVKGL